MWLPYLAYYTLLRNCYCCLFSPLCGYTLLKIPSISSSGGFWFFSGKFNLFYYILSKLYKIHRIFSKFVYYSKGKLVSIYCMIYRQGLKLKGSLLHLCEVIYRTKDLQKTLKQPSLNREADLRQTILLNITYFLIIE